MFCPECGGEIARLAEYCESCGADLRLHISKEEHVNLHNNIIDDRIAEKSEEIQKSGQKAPGLLFVAGSVVFIYGLLYSVPATITGIICMVFAFFWSRKRKQDIQRLQRDIRDLKSQLITPRYD